MLLFEPTNEQEVVYLFGFVCKQLGYKVERIQTAFPDCILVDNNNKRIIVEFEFVTSNFIKHRHPIEKCNLVVAWLDDCLLKGNIEVLELCEYFPALPENPHISKKDIRTNKTREVLALIYKDKAHKENLIQIFNKYQFDEKIKEPVRLISRFITNGGDPYVENGKLRLKNKIDINNFVYGGTSNKNLTDRAKEILDQLDITLH